MSVVKDIECHVLFKEIALSPFNLDRSRFNETEVYRGEDMNVESPDRSRETGKGREDRGRAGGGRVFCSLREFLQSVLLYRVGSPRIGSSISDFSCIPESRSDRSERSTERPPELECSARVSAVS